MNPETKYTELYDDLELLASIFETWATKGEGPLTLGPLNVARDSRYPTPMYCRWETHLAFMAFVEGVLLTVKTMRKMQPTEETGVRIQ